jgi:hypothetical protein
MVCCQHLASRLCRNPVNDLSFMRFLQKLEAQQKDWTKDAQRRNKFDNLIHGQPGETANIGSWVSIPYFNSKGQSNAVSRLIIVFGVPTELLSSVFL